MTLTTGPALTGPRLRLGGGAAAGVVVVCGRGRGVRPGGRGPGVRGEVLIQAGVRHGRGRAVGKIKLFKRKYNNKKNSHLLDSPRLLEAEAELCLTGKCEAEWRLEWPDPGPPRDPILFLKILKKRHKFGIFKLEKC